MSRYNDISNRQGKVARCTTTTKERYQIHSLLKAKQSISQIVRLLVRHRITISREHGRAQRGYSFKQAFSKASERVRRNRYACL
jgi:IS30 family transposase